MNPETRTTPMAPEFAALETALEQRGWGLKFEVALEARWRAAFRDEHLRQRGLLFLLAAVMVALTPLEDFALHPPAAFTQASYPLLLGLALPLLLAAAAACLRRLHAALTERLSLAAAFTLSTALLILHIVGDRCGFRQPIGIAAIMPIGTLLLGGMRFAPTARMVLPLFAADMVAALVDSDPLQSRVNDMEFLLVAAVLSTAGAYFQERMERRSWLQAQMLAALARADPLTGLLTRDAFMRAFDLLHGQAAAEQRPLLVALIDADHFKRLNDEHGHDAGDQGLRSIAQVTQQKLSASGGLCARYGGEELVYAGLAPARPAAEETLQDLCALVAANHACRTTVSVGAVWAMPSVDPESLLSAADRMLYQAKKLGRNRVAFADPVTHPNLCPPQPRRSRLPPRRLPPDESAALKADLAPELRRLRFTPPLETEFLAHAMARSQQHQVVTLTAVALLLAGFAALDWAFMSVSPPLLGVERALQLYSAPPLLLVCALLIWRLRGFPWLKEALVAACAAILALMLEWERCVAAGVGVKIPIEFAALSVGAAFMLGQLRLRPYFPLLAATWIVLSAIEWQAPRAADAMHRDLYSLDLLMIATVVGSALRERAARFAWAQARRLRLRSERDGLTGLLNRRAFHAALEARRLQAGPWTVAVLDLDHFKMFNDLHGHAAGDEALRRFAAALARFAGEFHGAAGRLGGEEFGLLLGGLDAERARRRLDGFCEEVSELVICAPGVGARRITVSIGACTGQVAPHRLLQLADESCYAAKEMGRNTVAVRRPPEEARAA